MSHMLFFPLLKKQHFSFLRNALNHMSSHGPYGHIPVRRANSCSADCSGHCYWSPTTPLGFLDPTKGRFGEKNDLYILDLYVKK